MPDFLRWLTSDDVYPWVMGMLGILVLLLFRAWAWVRRLRGDLALAVDDPTEPDDLMAVADAVAEDTCSTPEEEPTAQYEPCTFSWPTDDLNPCGDGDWHRCTRIPGGHRMHVCACRHVAHEDEVVLVVDPPTVRQYVVPQGGEWVTFGKHRVHQRCMDARRDGQPITDGCAAHLIGAATDLPTGGAA